MISRVVPHYDSVFPPVRVLVIELFDQLTHEELHRVAIGVRLQETCVELSVTVEGSDERDPRLDLLDSYAVSNTFSLPAPASVVSGVDPTLVDVEKPLPCL